MEETQEMRIFPSKVKWLEVRVMDREEREVWRPVEEVVIGKEWVKFLATYIRNV